MRVGEDEAQDLDGLAKTHLLWSKGTTTAEHVFRFFALVNYLERKYGICRQLPLQMLNPGTVVDHDGVSCKKGTRRKLGYKNAGNCLARETFVYRPNFKGTQASA